MPRITRSFAALLFAFATASAWVLFEHSLRADTAAQTIPFSQTWSNTSLITTNDNWSGVSGIVGYRGDDLTTVTGVDPQTILIDGTNTPLNVVANTSVTNNVGGVLEVETGVVDPTIAVQGSGTADAPFVLLNLNTSGFSAIHVGYDLRDLDASTDNAIQQVALHYRVGSSGNFTNIPAGYVADATTGPSLATLVTPVRITLPAEADNQPLVQIRIMTTNAVGNDELVGIDNITVTGTQGGSTSPTAVGVAAPNAVTRGDSTILTVAVTPGANPPSSALLVTADLSAIGGSPAQRLFDDGVIPDVAAGDNAFSYEALVPLGVTEGAKTLPVTVTDGENRTASAAISLTILDPVQPPPFTVVSLPYTQDWTATTLIATDDNWNGVPGFVGYRGDGLVGAAGVDPRTVTADGSATPVDVNANKTTPNTFATGGVAEFEIANPTIALQGSGTARAPHVVLNLDTRGSNGIAVRYDLRDIDGSGDDAVQPVALQYRVGSAGNYGNVPGGFTADATTGPNLATAVTSVNVTLPSDADDQPLVQLRFITTDATGADEWVGIDNIEIHAAPSNPQGAGQATPSSVSVGDATLITVAVTPGGSPPSTGISVEANLSLIGGSPAQTLADDGLNGDAASGDNVFSYLATIGVATAPGLTTVQATVSDLQGRSSTTEIGLTILSPTDPTAVGTATPSSVSRGFGTLLQVSVTPGTGPTSTGLVVVADLSSIGGSPVQPLLDDGLHGDTAANDRVFSLQYFTPSLTAVGPKTLPVSISDAQGRTASASIALTIVAPPPPGHALPFFQNWSGTSLITANDDWSGVPGIVGYLGDDASTTATNLNPALLLSESLSTTVDVIANQAAPNTQTTGGVAEFDAVPNPTIALQGSGTADAPNLVISIDTTTHSSVRVSYSLRDIDGSADNAVQQVALQYRIGDSGQFTNIPAAYVGDASSGPGVATLVTSVSVLLPPPAGNQPLVQLRIITTNAPGSDEWIGIDDIAVVDTDAPTSPVGSGSASPSSVAEGNTTLLTVAVTPGVNPPSTGVSVVADLSGIGGSSAQSFADDGLSGDVAAGDNVFSFQATVSTGTPPGPKTLPGAVTDLQFRTSAFGIALTVSPPPPQFHSIAEIQGSASQSPLRGLGVVTDGIVTAVKSNGFFIETAAGQDDGNPLTSEGVFVFTSSAPPQTAAVGNLVRVTGFVQEFVPGADPFQRPVTEISGFPQVSLLSTGNALPTPVVIAAADTTSTGGLEQLERYEGMRVQVDSLTVTAATLGSVNEANATAATSSGVFYGVITGVGRPFREPGIELPDPLPAGAPANVPRFDGNPERLQVDSDALGGAKIEVAAGDIVTNLVGPLDYAFRTYMILPEPQLPPTVFHITVPAPVSMPASSQFTIASANVERFFDTVDDPQKDDAVLTQTAFNNRLNKISLYVRDILQAPDIISVEEVEHLSTLQAIANKINADSVAANKPNPNYVAYLEEGNDIGGIDSGFLVKASRVAVVDVTQFSKTTTYINPNNSQPEILNDRPPLVLRAVVQNMSGSDLPITVIANHLRSLSGVDDPVDGNRIRTKRQKQAEDLAGLIQLRQAADPNERIISVGDYNVFQFNDGFVDSIGTIKGTPAPPDQVTLASPDFVNPDLIDLVDTMPADQRYSFVFDGNAQLLDHELITQNLLGLFNHLEASRANADFPESARSNPLTPTRVSDHDALVSYFDLPAPLPTHTLVESSLNPSTFGHAVTFTATVTANGGPANEGSVTFRDGATALTGVLTLDALGHTSFSTSGLSLGDHVISADFSGSSHLDPSSGSVAQHVKPGLSIGDVVVTEGNGGGTRTAVFSVTLSPASNQIVTVDAWTSDGTATAPSDYIAQPPTTLTFAPGATTRSITVTVKNDNLNEQDEHFFVNLSNSTNAVITDSQGVGTVTNNDRRPKLRIHDVTVTEGDAGITNAIFVVRLSAPSEQIVTVDFATASDTAREGADFVAAAGTLTFAPLTTSQTITVAVIGDTVSEGNETLFVNLSNAVNGVVVDGQVRGTIIDDDRPRSPNHSR